LAPEGREEIENRGKFSWSMKEIPSQSEMVTSVSQTISLPRRSILNSDLRGIHEIKKRIQKAINQMHELTHLWRNKHIKLGIKAWLSIIYSPTS
jgi:hypothetical protein